MMLVAFRRFKDFLKEKHSVYEFNIRAEHLNREMMSAFVEYLQSRSVGGGAKAIYHRFKKVIEFAIEQDVIIKNPCNGVSCRADDQILRKDVLSLEEIQTLINCHYKRENSEVRRAFIFCLYCGLRFCDVKDLTFQYSNRLLKFEQHKTKGGSANSGVVIPLNAGLLSLIGNPPKNGNMDSFIFTLSYYGYCCKSVKRWVKQAGINKNIGWHCARHSFAVNIQNNGTNIKTVASLLGHSGIKHTEKYRLLQ